MILIKSNLGATEDRSSDYQTYMTELILKAAYSALQAPAFNQNEPYCQLQLTSNQLE